VERGNVSLRRPFIGTVIHSADGSKEAIQSVKQLIVEKLRGTAYAGEDIFALLSDSDLFSAQSEQHKFIVPKFTYDTIMEFEAVRKKSCPKVPDTTKSQHWMHADPPLSVVEQWKDWFVEPLPNPPPPPHSIEFKRRCFYELEHDTQTMKRHTRLAGTYGIVIAKCPNFEECSYCDEYPRRPARCTGENKCQWCIEHPGIDDVSYSFWDNKDPDIAKVAFACPSNAICPVDPCFHKLDYDFYLTALEVMKLVQVRRCGICRQEGHTKKKCPQKKPEVQHAIQAKK